MRKKRIVVATRDPARVNRLLSVLTEWFQIDIITKTLSADSQSEAQVVFCRTSDDLQSGFSVSRALSHYAAERGYFRAESFPDSEEAMG
jgi:hypothetical protein